MSTYALVDFPETCFSTSKDSERAPPAPRPRTERAARGAQVASGEVMNAVRKAEALSQDSTRPPPLPSY